MPWLSGRRALCSCLGEPLVLAVWRLRVLGAVLLLGPGALESFLLLWEVPGRGKENLKVGPSTRLCGACPSADGRIAVNRGRPPRLRGLPQLSDIVYHHAGGGLHFIIFRCAWSTLSGWSPGPFHSLVFPAQAGIHVVLPREDCHRPRSCRFPLSGERRDPFNPIRKMKRPWGGALLPRCPGSGLVDGPFDLQYPFPPLVLVSDPGPLRSFRVRGRQGLAVILSEGFCHLPCGLSAVVRFPASSDDDGAVVAERDVPVRSVCLIGVSSLTSVVFSLA